MLIRAATCADTAAIARVSVDAWRTTYGGILPADLLAGLTYADREQTWIRALCRPESQTFVYVAEDATGAVVGFAAGGPTRDEPDYPGELYAIYILAAHQRHGLGRRLAAPVVERLILDGYPAMLIWALAANAPARAFYERLGGVPVREKEVSLGGVPFCEIGYGWTDLPALALALTPPDL
jgi:GNAT superfamily N-acetyltransferase